MSDENNDHEEENVFPLPDLDGLSDSGIESNDETPNSGNAVRIIRLTAPTISGTSSYYVRRSNGTWFTNPMLPAGSDNTQRYITIELQKQNNQGSTFMVCTFPPVGEGPQCGYWIDLQQPPLIRSPRTPPPPTPPTPPPPTPSTPPPPTPPTPPKHVCDMFKKEAQPPSSSRSAGVGQIAVKNRNNHRYYRTPRTRSEYMEARRANRQQCTKFNKIIPSENDSNKEDDNHLCCRTPRTRSEYMEARRANRRKCMKCNKIIPSENDSNKEDEQQQ